MLQPVPLTAFFDGGKERRKITPIPLRLDLGVRIGVPDAKAAAHVEHICFKAELFFHFSDEGKIFFRRKHKGLLFKDLRADMAMEAAQPQMLLGEHIFGDLLRRAACDGEAELGVGRRRLHIGVRVRLYARVDADEHVLHEVATLSLPFNEVGFGVRIDDDRADAAIERI